MKTARTKIQLIIVWNLCTETVESSALAFEGVNNIHGSDGLTTGVFSVGNSITDDGFKEHLQDDTSFIIDKVGDTLDTTSTGETTNSRLGDALDVITELTVDGFAS